MRRSIVAGAVVIVLALGVAPWLPSYPLTLLTQAVIVAILAMSLDVLLGYTGLASLGHAAYFGIAAYAVGILSTQYQRGFLTCLLVGVMLATLAAAVFGLLAIRAVGTYFLMITLALGMVVWGLAFRWVSMTKGITASPASRGPRSACRGVSGIRSPSSTSRSRRWCSRGRCWPSSCARRSG